MSVVDQIRARCIVLPESGCWIWQGNVQSRGYGSMTYRGTDELVHRVMYVECVGPIPDGCVLDHVRTRGCIDTRCCNPAHLEAVTQAENCRRGRKAKLTVAQVIEIKRAVDVPSVDLAARFGVATTTISGIRRGKRWKDVAA